MAYGMQTGLPMTYGMQKMFTYDVWYAKAVYLCRMACKRSLLMKYGMQNKFTHDVWYAKKLLMTYGMPKNYS